eukprot:1510122-Pyramimonas_sp.AAC.1
MLPRRRPASAREVDATPAHALRGFAHFPVHPLLLTNQALGLCAAWWSGKASWPACGRGDANGDVACKAW